MMLDHPELFAPRLAGPPGPLPADASAYPVGSLWVDDANRLWQCDYAGNFVNNGSSALADKVQTTTTFNPNNNFSLKIAFRQDATAVDFTGLFCQSTDGTGFSGVTRGVWMERQGTRIALLICAPSGSVFSAAFNGVIDGLWHKLEVTRVGNLITGVRDGVQVFSLPLDVIVNIPAYTAICAQPTSRTMNGQVSCVEVVADVGALRYCFTQTSGTVIQDLSGNGNKGTLTDGSPATFSGNKYWIPVDVRV